MPAVPALVLPVAGPYTGTWDGFSLGTQNDDGFILQGTYQGQEINASDAYGMTLVEAIFRGINWRMRFRGLEWNKPGILAAMQAFGAVEDFLSPPTVFKPVLENIGDRWSNYANPLVLTAILGNPPTMPQTLTALNAVMAPQTNVESVMTSKMREAPIEMVLIPYHSITSAGTFNLSFTTT